MNSTYIKLIICLCFQRSYDNTAWINDQDPLTFSTTSLNEKLIEAVKDISKDENASYYPYR